MTQEPTVVDRQPTYSTDPFFFKKFSTERFMYEDLGLNESILNRLHEENFFRTRYDNYYLRRVSDKVINNAITNATKQRLELHSVLLYLRDSYPNLTPEGDDIFFFTHFKGNEFNELRSAYSKNEKIEPKQFLSLLLLANINSRNFQEEAKERLTEEEPSEVFVDIVNRVLE
jgi:hypothetical protein